MRQLPFACLIFALLAGRLQAGEGAKGDPAMEPERVQKVHGHFAAECFNQCWTLIDKAERSPEEAETMLLLAHASLWHWKQRSDCTPDNLAVGYWQVSRVYALVGNPAMAADFGNRCLRVARDNKLPAFHLGYAYEALARAEFLRGNGDRARDLLARAREELTRVKDGEEQQVLGADLDRLANSPPGKAGAGGP